jgi:NhaP-type Na+/H+ or K+/H+ antiporter
MWRPGGAPSVRTAVSDTEILVGLGLIVGLAVASQVVAARWSVPAIVLLLPSGFLAGELTDEVDPQRIFGAAWSPLVSLAIGVVVFDAALGLRLRELEGHGHRVVRRLLVPGIPLTWGAAAGLGALLLGLPSEAAVMLGAILIVSGPTVVAPLLAAARPGERVASILGWESTSVDPLGAIIGVLVFQALVAGAGDNAVVGGLDELAGRLALGAAVGAGGALVLWLLLMRLKLRGALGADAVLGVVVSVVALCDAVETDTGLFAALVMGVTLANHPAFDLPDDPLFLEAIVQFLIGFLFVSISATVTASSVGDVIGPTLVLVLGLVLVVRPLVAVLATRRTSLSRAERIYIAAMDPRGIIAAFTATSFSAPLAAAGVEDAADLLPVTFVVIAATVALYGLSAVPLARRLGLSHPEP